MVNIYHDYLKSIYKTYMSGDATEPTYYYPLKELLENFVKESEKVAGITVQPKKTKAGIPDFLLKTKQGEIIGYIEAKEPLVDSLINEAQTEQLQRYRESLPNLILTNFLEFYLFREGKIINEVCLAKRTRFLSSLILEELGQETEGISGVYKAFKEELIESLTEESSLEKASHLPGEFEDNMVRKGLELSGTTESRVEPSFLTAVDKKYNGKRGSRN